MTSPNPQSKQWLSWNWDSQRLSLHVQALRADLGVEEQVTDFLGIFPCLRLHTHPHTHVPPMHVQAYPSPSPCTPPHTHTHSHQNISSMRVEIFGFAMKNHSVPEPKPAHVYMSVEEVIHRTGRLQVTEKQNAPPRTRWPDNPVRPYKNEYILGIQAPQHSKGQFCI